MILCFLAFEEDLAILLGDHAATNRMSKMKQSEPLIIVKEGSPKIDLTDQMY